MTQPTQADSPHRNTKTSRSRVWCLTINNYSNELYKDMMEEFPIDSETQAVLGKEIGEQGTKHLQCCIKYKSQRTFNSMKNKYPTAHIEICKNWDASVIYCKKEGSFYTNIVPVKTMLTIQENYMRETFDDVKWYPWQQNILDILKTKPNRRTIHWFWESEGNKGKSFLSEFLFLSEKALIINGKTNDIFNAVKTYIDVNKEYPSIIIGDIPRDNREYITYGTLEKLKDGVFNSGKYEGGQIWLPPLHLICLANFEPSQTKISKDRWNIIENTECSEIPSKIYSTDLKLIKIACELKELNQMKLAELSGYSEEDERKWIDTFWEIRFNEWIYVSNEVVVNWCGYKDTNSHIIDFIKILIKEHDENIDYKEIDKNHNLVVNYEYSLVRNTKNQTKPGEHNKKHYIITGNCLKKMMLGSDTLTGKKVCKIYIKTEKLYQFLKDVFYKNYLEKKELVDRLEDYNKWLRKTSKETIYFEKYVQLFPIYMGDNFIDKFNLNKVGMSVVNLDKPKKLSTGYSQDILYSLEMSVVLGKPEKLSTGNSRYIVNFENILEVNKAHKDLISESYLQSALY